MPFLRPRDGSPKMKGSIVTLSMSRRALLGVGGAALTAVLAACSSTDPLAEQANAGDNKNYIAGDGSVTEYGAADRPALLAVLRPLTCRPYRLILPPRALTFWV